MLDVISRAAKHPIDYSGICRITDLKLVKKIDEGNGVFSFIMKADRLPSWKAGQHAIFTLPGRPVKGRSWRPFSVASAPHEGVIRIGTIVPPEPSSFKQQLSSLEIGDKVRMYGPYGELYIRPGLKQIIGVAGGIGITPFRSIISGLHHSRRNVHLTLIYSAKDSHTYRDELDAFVRENHQLKIIHTHPAEEVNAELEKQVASHGNRGHYFLSGAPKMIEALREKLSALGIENGHVCNDPFKGY